MIKLNQSSSANLNVLSEDKLGQVVGGRGHGGGNRWRKYDHCYKNRYNDCYNYEGGYEGKGYCEDRYEDNYNDCYEDNYDRCDRRYS